MGDFVEEEGDNIQNTTIENYMLRVQDVKRDITNSILSR